MFGFRKGPKVATSDHRVLIVDDDASIRKVVGSMVESLGFDAVLADSGLAAAQVLSKRNHRIGLILLDIMMPQMGGYMFLQLLRKELDKNLPVVVMSALEQAGSMSPGYHGADFHVVKPLSLEKLKRVLYYFLTEISDEERTEIESELLVGA